MPYRTIEFDAFAIDLEKHAAFLILNSGTEIDLEQGYLTQDVGAGVIHGSGIRRQACFGCVVGLNERVCTCSADVRFRTDGPTGFSYNARNTWLPARTRGTTARRHQKALAV